jgi:hypothetical protein
LESDDDVVAGGPYDQGDNDPFHPLRLAQEAATVDLLTDGRLELGLGSGWNQPEYEVLDVAWLLKSRAGRVDVSENHRRSGATIPLRNVQTVRRSAALFAITAMTASSLLGGMVHKPTSAQRVVATPAGTLRVVHSGRQLPGQYNQPGHYDEPERRSSRHTAANAMVSENWSGYAEIGAYTNVSGSWTVPSVDDDGGGEYSSTWVGVDGVDSSDLIQTGTSQDSDGSYYSWWEILPSTATRISDAPVAPGDSLSASLSEVASGVWNITLIDYTQHWEYNVNHYYSGPAGSAEWIEEAPTINQYQSALADYGTVSFVAADVQGGSADLNTGEAIEMEDGYGDIISTPSAPNTAGDEFNLAYGDVAPSPPSSPTPTPPTPTPLPPPATPPRAPSAPGDVRAKLLAPTKVLVSWHQPTSTSGERVVRYVVEMYHAGRLIDTWRFSANYVRVDFHGFSANYACSFRIAAVTAAGKGAFSARSNMVRTR